MKAAVEVVLNAGAAASNQAYDPTKISLMGTEMVAWDGGTPDTQWVGPAPIALARPMEQAIAIPGVYPHVVRWSSTIDYVFLADNATAAATRRLSMYEYSRLTRQFTWVGAVTLTFPTATNHTIAGFRVTLDRYLTGTVAVNGTAVTGTGTAWLAEVAAGARIGFPTVAGDATTVPVWYDIASLTSDTVLTLSSSAGVIAAGANFIIEEMRAVVSTTNATAANGGLFVAKGLSRNAFTALGPAIPAATTIDNLRAVYWLADAATVTNTAAKGVAIQDRAGANHYVYIIDGANKVFKYDIRVALASLASGKSTSAFLFATGAQAPTGTLSATNNGRIGTLNHGPGNGILSLYFVTTTRVYRASVSNITNGNVNWFTDAMTEVPPGGTGTTFQTTGSMSSVEIASTMDRLFITTTQRAYATQFNTVANPFDHVFLIDAKQTDQGTESADTQPFPSSTGSAFSIWVESGIMYLARIGTAATTNQLYAIPVGAHWGYGQYITTPKMATPGAISLGRAYINARRGLGANELVIGLQPYRAYIRTTGIDDNTGAWNLITSYSDLSGYAAASYAQLRFEFQILGHTLLSARIHAVSITYTVAELPAELQWNVNDSGATDGTLAFIQTALFTGSVPGFTISYFRADTNALVLTQASTSTTNGVFEYWTGLAWTAGLGPNTVGTRRRFRPTAGLPAGVDLYATLASL